MVVTGVLSLASMLALAAGRSLVFALAVSGAQEAGDAAPPTAKEQALMEHMCRSVQVGLAHDAYDQCLAAQLRSLRTDFGRDLSRLAAPARAKIDAACAQATTLRGREGYIECLSAQLLAMKAPPARPAPAAPADAPVPAVETTTAPVAAPSDESASSFLNARTVSAALGAVVVLGGLAFFGFRARSARHVCKTCGVGVPGAAELCAACRHDAAEAKRQAAGERAERQRAAEAEARRQQEEAESLQFEQQRRQEEAERRRLEEARRVEEEAARRAEEERRQAEARERAAAAASSDADDSIFDPYLALGLPPGASDDEVRAAYEEARLKYDPEEVAHLGYDLKQHFAKKWKAARRAYEMLAGSLAER